MTRRLLPDPTDRLRFREMTARDLADMARMLGDPEVMAFYPAPKTRAESATDDHAHPWIVRTVMGMTVEPSGQSAD